MNDLAYRLALQEAIKRKFYGHDKLKSKHVPQYAISAERQYSQTFANLHREVEKEVQKYVPKIVRLIEQERSSQTRTDDFSDFASKIKQFMQQLLSSITGRIFTIHRINDLLKETGLLAEKNVNRQWFQSVKKTLGIDILEDYYNGAFYEQILGEWIRENLDLITTIPKELTSQLESTIMEGFLSGSRAEEIAKEIRRTCKVSESRARFIARDQVGKLQSRLTQYQQQDAGIEEYVWSTSEDSRVRKSHRRLNNKKFRWDNPPVVDEKTGRRCHPGEDYGCRCVALPVFNLNITLPWEKRSGGDG